jgi:hypothetical protein
MLASDTFKCHFGVYNINGIKYLLPVATLQMLILRGQRVKLFFGTLSEAIDEECKLRAERTSKNPVDFSCTP